jgi:hypothetical protein
VKPGRDLLFSPPAVAPTRDDLGVVLVSGTRDDSAERREGAHAWGQHWKAPPTRRGQPT